MQQFPQQYPQKLWQTLERNRGIKSSSLTARTKDEAPRATNRMSDLIAHVDGGSHGSPGPSGIGVVITKPDGEMVRIAKWIGHHDNNVAEYAALLEALQFAVELKARALLVYTDSEVVVKQMTGEYACRSPRLYSLHWTCRKLARSLDFAIAHIPRERNLEANRLANHAARRRRDVPVSSL
jgi:ribonuclease HI